MLTAAHEHMDYDLGILAPKETDSQAKPLPAPWRRVDATPRTVVLEKKGVRLGVVIFPEHPETPERAFKAISSRTQRLHRTCDLVLGVSSWGKQLEREFLTQAPGAVDILQGSGPGGPLPFRLTTGGKTVWVRPYSKGKTVQRLDILELPRQTPTTWNKGQNIALRLVSLNEDMPEDATVAKTLQDAGAKQ